MAVVPPASAVVDAVPLPVGPRPGATRVDFAVGDRVQASVDVGTGNLLVTTTGLTLPGIDRDVQLGLDYNSLLVGSDSPAADGAAGTGWQMRLGADTRLVANDDGSVLYLAPGGRQGLYEPTSAGASSYTSPAGFKNTLVQTSAGWELSDHTSNAMSVFDTAGKLRTIRDRNGQQTTFDYSSSGAQRLQQITSTRGGPGARTVEVNFAYGVLGSLTQTGDDGTVRKVEYGYDDVTGASPLLTSITDPAGRVTNFGYDTADRLTSVTNTAGVQTTFGYDSTNRVTDVVRDMGEIAATTRFAYASDTQTLVADPNTDPTTPVATGPHTTYSLDG
ncbi:MAG TPA: DUF6531 domain-containing protein, partial [Nocardioidaceae bacterium]|nr:DUF6531 domain-containing protein [Nocardioidaceae bacterium]